MVVSGDTGSGKLFPTAAAKGRGKRREIAWKNKPLTHRHFPSYHLPKKALFQNRARRGEKRGWVFLLSLGSSITIRRLFPSSYAEGRRRRRLDGKPRFWHISRKRIYFYTPPLLRENISCTQWTTAGNVGMWHKFVVCFLVCLSVVPLLP